MNTKNCRNNIVLIGMMGVGKSAVARLLAEDLDFEFVDTDSILEEVTSLKLGEILSKYGKIRYESEENLVIAKMVGRKNCVIATGGTMVQSAKNQEIIKNLGLVVWLNASAETIYKRVKRKKNLPLLTQGKKNATLDMVVEIVNVENENFAAIADVKIDVDQFDLEQVVAKIKKQYLLLE